MFKSLSASATATVMGASFGVVLSLAAPMAAAAPVDWDFTGTETTFGPTQSFSGTGGALVDASAFRLTGTGWVAEDVRRQGNALGVNSDPGDTNNGQIGPRVEGLLFDLQFLQYGSFTVNFSAFTGADNADIWISATDIIANSFVGATQVANDSTTDPFTAANQSFRFIFVANDATPSTATPSCDQDGAQTTTNCFRVTSLQVDATQTIPEPGSLVLVSAALLLANTVIRRRSLTK